jgi:hypothetical protein
MRKLYSLTKDSLWVTRPPTFAALMGRSVAETASRICRIETAAVSPGADPPLLSWLLAAVSVEVLLLILRWLAFNPGVARRFTHNA